MIGLIKFEWQLALLRGEDLSFSGGELILNLTIIPSDS